MTPVFVNMARLVTLHPGYHLIRAGGSGVSAQGLRPTGTPSTLRAVTVAPLKPFEVTGTRPVASSEPRDQMENDRLAALEKHTLEKLRKLDARQARLDLARLASERADKTRAAEERVQAAHNTLAVEARKKMRDLDIRLIGLRSRLGSLAGGPPAEVEAAIRKNRAERASVESQLAVDLSRIRSAEYQRVRDEMEELEIALARRREQSMSTWLGEASQMAQNYRAYRHAWDAGLPPAYIPEARPVKQPASSGMVSPVTRRRADEWPLAHEQDNRAWLMAVRADVAMVAAECAARRGWRIVSAASPQVPDRTEALAAMLRDYWYGASAE